MNDLKNSKEFKDFIKNPKNKRHIKKHLKFINSALSVLNEYFEKEVLKHDLNEVELLGVCGEIALRVMLPAILFAKDKELINHSAYLFKEQIQKMVEDRFLDLLDNKEGLK